MAEKNILLLSHDNSRFCILLDKPHVDPRAVSKWVSKWVTNLCSAETRVGPLHFQAGYCRRWLNLALVFWVTVCKMVRRMLSDRCLSSLSCPDCLSVCDSVLWPNGWMDQDETWHAGRPRPWPHCVRWGPSSPSPKGTHHPIFNKRELTFTFAICYRPSVCRLSVVGNARAPYSGGWNFLQYFYGIWYLGHLLTSTENFIEILQGEPLCRGN